MMRIYTLAKRVIQQMLADRRTLGLIIIVPIILLTVSSVLIRVEPSSITVAVVNNDTGFPVAGNEVNLGDHLLSVLHNFDEFETVELDHQQAHDDLQAGIIDAVIILPESFTTDVVRQQTLHLGIDYEGSNPSISDRLDTIFERASLQAVNSLVAVNMGSQEMSLATEIEATYLHGGAEYDFLDYMAPALIGFFVFFFVFLLTSISFLRERMAGTLERLQATPIQAHEIILGYMVGFLVFGLLQGAVTLLFTIYAIDIHYAGNLLNVFVVEILLVLVSVNLGIFLSTFAHNEFQVLQFIPLVVVTQVFLGGVFWEVGDMPRWLQPLAQVMPLTHANAALRAVMIEGESLLNVLESLAALLAIAALMVLLSAWTAARVRI